MSPTANRIEHPLIAVNGLLDPGETPRLNLPLRYADSVLKAGGVPVAIPPVGGPADVLRLLERVDGLLLTGGDDFRTECLGLGPTHTQAVPTPQAKQDFDFELVRAALACELPILGICYGMQLLALNDGGTLYQHLPEDLPGSREHRGNVAHSVRVEPGTKLAGLLGVEACEVISRHHQGVASLSGPWRVGARDEEDLIEAIEHTSHPFAVAVQWHPELASEGSLHDLLFRGLVGAAATRQARALLPSR